MANYVIEMHTVEYRGERSDAITIAVGVRIGETVDEMIARAYGCRPQFRDQNAGADGDFVVIRRIAENGGK